MTLGKLGFPVFDADNHMYETKDYVTKFLPIDYRSAVQTSMVQGQRPKMFIETDARRWLPFADFENAVPSPGALEDFYRFGNPSGRPKAEFLGAISASHPGFQKPEERIQLMDSQGIDRTLLFPSLAIFLEERLKNDLDALGVLFHSINEWIYETWTFDFETRIFATPMLTMSNVDQAIAEIDWLLERGARCLQIRPGPVPVGGFTRSPGLEQFDPIWEKIQDSGLLVCMHSSDSGYRQVVNWWEEAPKSNEETSMFRMLLMEFDSRPIYDTMAALICHGTLTRFPAIRIVAIESGGTWASHLLGDLQNLYQRLPQRFAEDPGATFRRCISVSPFYTDDLHELVGVVGAENLLFGSDYPHPEGLRDPVSFVNDLQGLPQTEVAKIMGGNLTRLLHLD